MTLEANHEEFLRVSVIEAKGLCIKLPSQWYKGIPDRLLLLPGARVVFVELKKIKGKGPSVHQHKWRTRLKTLGFEHVFLTGHKEVKDWVNEQLNNI